MSATAEMPPLVRHRSLVLVALGLVVYVAFLGLRDLWYPDEPDIGEVAQAMFVSGDWISPRRNGVIWVDYPPLIYWTSCIAAQLLGAMSEFALRVPTALAAIALVLVTCAAATRWFDARTGLWAGFLLATFVQYMYGAISYRPDMLFSLAIGAGLLTYARGAGEQGRWWPRVAAFAFFGLAILAKGPLGVLLPGLVLVLWHGTRREWRRIVELAPLTVVAVALSLPWFIAGAKAMGAEDLWGEIYAQNFQRFGSGFRGHRKPPLYYLRGIWGDVAPWSPMLPFAIWWIFKSGRWRDRNVQLALWWFGAFFVFLSIAATKRQVYMMPAYPAIALLLAPWAATVLRTEASGGGHDAPDPRPARVLIVGVAALFVAFGLVFVGVTADLDSLLGRFDLDSSEVEIAHALRVPVLVMGLVVTTLGVVLWRTYRVGPARRALAGVGVVHVVLYMVLAAWVGPAFNPHKTYRPQCEWILSQIGDETHVGLYFPRLGHRKKGAFGYYTGRLVEAMVEADELEGFFERHPGSVVLVSEEVADDLLARANGGWASRVVRELIAGRYRYVVVRGS